MNLLNCLKIFFALYSIYSLFIWMILLGGASQVRLIFMYFNCFLKVKSRMMGDPSYKSTLDCFIKTLKNDVSVLLTDFTKLLEEKIIKKKRAEVYAIHGFSGVLVQGPLAFYKGFIPNFGRLGSWNVIMFLTLEQVQSVSRGLLFFFVSLQRSTCDCVGSNSRSRSSSSKRYLADESYLTGRWAAPHLTFSALFTDRFLSPVF